MHETLSSIQMKLLINLLQKTLLLLILTSCVQTKKIIETPIEPGLDFKLAELNGLFSNQPVNLNQNGGDPLGKFFFNQMKTYQWSEPIDLEGKIKINVKDQQTLKIQFWKGNSLMCENEVSGKIKDNFFALDRQVQLIGFPFIYFFYRESRILLSTDNEGNLIVKQGRAHIGNILIATFGNYDYLNYKFEKTSMSNPK